jgi:hypothetical protein
MRQLDSNNAKDSSSRNITKLSIGGYNNKNITKERLFSPKNSVASKSGNKINDNLKSRLQSSPLRNYNPFDKAGTSLNYFKKTREASNSEPKPHKTLQKLTCITKKSVSPNPNNNRKAALGVVLNGTHKYPINQATVKYIIIFDSIN